MKMRKTVFMAVAAIAAVVAFADEGPTFNGAIGTGGTITAAKDTSGDAVHTFTESGFFTAPASADLQVRVLVVAGGGAGGRGTDNAYTCGGGGGGGVIFNDATTLLTIKAGETVTVTVGAGGQPAAVGTAANGGNGGDSRIVGNGFSYTALGGGGGGTKNANGSSGGNGGGGGGVGRSGGTYTQSFVWGSISYHGYSGGKGDAYCGSGGGGAGGNAPNNPNNDRPSNGGAGLASDITGETVYYAGGGGGGCSNTGNSTGYGGTGGGGHGAGCTVGGVVTRSVDLTNGTDGLGGGGGGGGGYWGSYDHKPLTGRGGSGVVIFRYTPVPRRVSTITSVGDATIGTVKFDVNVVDTGDDDQKVTVECAYAPTGSELGAYQTIATGVGNGSNVTKRIY